MHAPFDIEVFHDGDRPLCNREIDMLKRLNAKRGRIRFTDIAAPGSNPQTAAATCPHPGTPGDVASLTCQPIVATRPRVAPRHA